MAKNYQRIRGKVAEDRCTNKGPYGSPSYCECGCQAPRSTDPDLNLNGVTVIRKSPNGYADYILGRGGVVCGELNTQYNYVYLDSIEYLGADGDYINQILGESLEAARNVAEEGNVSAGDTLTETAARVAEMDRIELAEQDERNKSQPGYCRRCHSYCYGDCEAN